MDDYFSIPRVSNSDLSKFKSEVVLSKPHIKPVKACNFGTVFHTLLLEPHLPVPLFEGINYKLIQLLVTKTSEHPLVASFLAEGEREQIILFEDEDTQAKCKCKIDLHTNLPEQGKHILDFKTTYAKNVDEFKKAIFTLDYDRQTAFYMDSIQASAFTFVGVQKVKPFDIFIFDTTPVRGFVDYGRKKYKALLKGYVKHYNLANAGFYRPLSAA